MGLEDIFVRSLTVEYVNVTTNHSNGTIVTQICFAKSSLNMDLINMFDFYLHCFIMTVVIGIGLFGNLTLIFVATKKLAFTSSYFLLMVALADLFVLITYCMYFTLPIIYEYLGFGTQYFKFYSSTQEYIWFSFIMCKAISTYSVVAMFGDRYAWLVTQKRKHGNLSNLTNARLAISLILALAIMFAFPKMLLFETTLAHDPCTDLYALNIDESKGLMKNIYFLIAYEAATEFLIGYITPLFCMIALLRGIHSRKVIWVRHDSYPGKNSIEANCTNHLSHDDGRISLPQSRTPSFLDSASRANSDKLDSDSAAALLANDVSRRPVALSDSVTKLFQKANENNECHVTNDLTRRLTVIFISYLILESPHCIYQLIMNIARIQQNPERYDPENTTVFLAALLNAASTVHYAIKFYLCMFFCFSFKEQCGKILWCFSDKKKAARTVGWRDGNDRVLGKEFKATTPIRRGDDTPPYGHSEEWV